MGWPVAVSSALMAGKRGALWRALAALGVGHLLAMLGILLPFALMYMLVEFEREIRIGAAMVVIAMGIYLLIGRAHPRFLARVKPSQLILWSFLIAMAHGAGLMLVPIYLELCRVDELDAGHRAAYALMSQNIGVALSVAVVHAAAMVVAGGGMAFAVYQVLGLKAVAATWFNLDQVWALSLVLVGCLGLWAAL